MKKTEIIVFKTLQETDNNSIQKLNMELFDQSGMMILKQHIISKVDEIYDKLCFHNLPDGKYVLKIKGETFSKFVIIRIFDN